MKITPLNISGAALVEIEPIDDERGYFARSFCGEEFRAAGLDFEVVQTNLSQNVSKGTLRGMHYQATPKPDAKLVSCIKGKIFDVIVDIRPESETFCQWQGFTISEDNRDSLFVPPGCAHGFLTLSDDSVVHYQMGEWFVSDLARGVRWDDPAFGIEWPMAPTVISERDSGYQDFGEV